MSTETPSGTREQIARRVLRTAYENTESWEYGRLGEHLAYLTMAILDSSELDLAESDEHTIETLRRLFSEGDVVWQYIKLPAPVDDRIPWRPTLTIGGLTCAEMAEKGEEAMRQYNLSSKLGNEPPEVIIGDLLSDISHALVKAGVYDPSDVLQEALDRALTCLDEETDVASHTGLVGEVPPVEPYDPAEFLIVADEEEPE